MSDQIQQSLPVIVFTDNTSHFGLRVQEWLNDHKIQFVLKDVSVKENLDEMVKFTDQYAVPVIKVGEEYIFGFHPKKMAELFAVME